MTCFDAEQMEQFLTGRTAVEGARELKGHLARCEECRSLAVEVASNLRFLEQLQDPDGCSREEGSALEEDQPVGGGSFPFGIETSFEGRYRLITELDRGGMGVVYLARQNQPERTVVLKVIHPRHASEEMIRRFEYEVGILGLLEHPGTARIYDAGVVETPTGRLPFFAMEFIDGEPITAWAKNTGASVGQKVALLVRLCEAIQYAHQKGVIHRDLKPGNILVDRSGQPKVLDYGLAFSVEHESAPLEGEGPVGTVPYMSPEQTCSQGIDTRSDVYALGVVAYETLGSRLPYDFEGRSLAEAFQTIREIPADPLRIGPRLAAKDLRAILAKALEKDPDLRYSSAADLGSELQRYLDGDPILARRSPLVDQVWKRARKHPALASSLLILTLAIGTLGGVFVWQEARLSEERRGRQVFLDRIRSAYFLYRKARVYIARGQKDLALPLLDEIVKLHPEFYIAFMDRAELRLPPRYRWRDPSEKKAVDSAVEDYVQAHMAKGGDPIVDPETGESLSFEDLEVRETNEDGFLIGLPNVQRVAETTYLLRSDESSPQPVGGPGVPRALLEAGFVLLRAGRLEESEKMFERAARADVGEVAQRIAYAGFLTLSYRREEALQELTKLSQDPLELEVDQEKVWAFLGYLHMRQALGPGEKENPYADGARAAEAYRQATRLCSDDPVYQLNLGVCLRDLGASDAAFSAYRNAIRLAPDLATAWNNYAVMLRERGRFRQAVEAYSRVHDLRPQDPVPLAELAELYAKLRDREACLSAARRLVATDPKQIDARYALLDAHLAFDENQEAIHVLSEAMDELGVRPDEVGLRGNLYLWSDRLELAEKDFRSCLATDADLVGRLGLASVARKRGDFELAEDWLHQAAARHAQYGDVALARARLEISREQPARAMKILRRAVRGGFAFPRLWLTFLRGLREIEVEGRAQLLLVGFEKSRRAFPHNHEISLEAARWFLRGEESMRNPELALEILEPLIAPMDNYWEPIELWALALLRLGRDVDAQRALDRYRDLRGETSSILLWQSILHSRAGNGDLARMCFHWARSRGADFPEESEWFLEDLTEAEDELE